MVRGSTVDFLSLQEPKPAMTSEYAEYAKLLQAFSKMFQGMKVNKKSWKYLLHLLMWKHLRYLTTYSTKSLRI